MTDRQRSYVEHVAVRVKDIQWYIRFLREVLGMMPRETDGPADAPRPCRAVGGMQLVATHDLEARRCNETGRLAHLGIMVENLEAAPRGQPSAPAPPGLRRDATS